MKLVYGVGINDLNYSVKIKDGTDETNGKRKRRRVWTCPYYAHWRDMLGRCFSEKLKQRHPTYKDITCTGEWFYASKFKDWMQEQNWKGKHLDKDIIIPNNKVYSPDTCAFVLGTTNRFVLDSGATRGEWPVGVHWSGRGQKFMARCSNSFTEKREYLGFFSCPQEAHEAWRKRKHELAQLVAATESDPRVVEALKKRYSYEEWYKHNPI